MPFICGGHPAPDSTPALLAAIQRAGASIVEIGIPFSDPIADGPVIASAMHTALEGGVTPDSIFEQIARVRADLSIGLVAMVSISIVQRMGRAGDRFVFLDRAREAGFDGLIVPDAPPEEAPDLVRSARDLSLTMSFLVAPTTPDARAERIVRSCTGFVYLLARLGITGERPGEGEAPGIEPAVARLRSMTDLPIACGFGISTPEQVARITAHADAAIVGSALVRRLNQAHDEGSDPALVAERFVGDLVRAV